MKRDDMFYYVGHIPRDLANHYSVKRLCFSLKTKSLGYAIRASKSVSQRLEDYCDQDDECGQECFHFISISTNLYSKLFLLITLWFTPAFLK